VRARGLERLGGGALSHGGAAPACTARHALAFRRNVIPTAMV
jgi:hypothetical protein